MNLITVLGKATAEEKALIEAGYFIQESFLKFKIKGVEKFYTQFYFSIS